MKPSGFYYIVRHMSKAKKISNSRAPEKPTGPIFSDKNGNIMVQVHAKPGAKSNGITGIEKEGVGVQINARPVEGEANTELLSYMTRVFGLKKSEISLDKVIIMLQNPGLDVGRRVKTSQLTNFLFKGMKSRQKVLLITKKDLTIDKIIEKLKEEMNQ